ncbi:Centrosomal protein of 41 kDa [Taenia crassiceps]|uniref:Centrosomal protein of 41 kDa n=1 Tax=Taenia crassiceps TaxID=6207 RepID=A0ABR4QQS8_9CEST
MKPVGFKKRPVEKKIKKNPHYADVLATIDSGASLSRYLRRLDEASETTYSSGRDVSKNMNKHTEPSDQSSFRAAGTYNLQSVIHGIGECDINGDKKPFLEKSNDITEQGIDCPYLLLDVRDRDEFDQCHIIRAISYPHTLLSRCINFEIREMLIFRNKPGHIIICYDEDERLAPHVATVLTERGYDNIFVLSGGLKVGWKLFPKGLILGDAPLTLKNKQGKRPRHEKNILHLLSASISNSKQSTCNVDNDTASSVHGSTIGDRGTTSSARRAVRYTFDTYEAVGSRGTPNGGEDFSMIDLAHLSLSLDSLCASSRVNRSSRINTSESVHSRTSSTSTTGEFK